MSSRKSLINSADEAVNEFLLGHIFTYPHLELHAAKRVVFKPGWDEPSSKVSVICGGGSGHEPFTAGFVGEGMLSASVSGSIFAAPPSSHVFHAIRSVCSNSKGGCLVIIPNYTGDCLNFGLAIEKAKHMGLKVEQVAFGEDCSIPDNEIGRAGKRALPGIVLMMKIAGALAHKGRNLEEITKFVESAVANVASCSIGLTACTIPGQGRMFELGNDEFEFGQGLHGEAGYKRSKLSSANKTIRLMIETIAKTLKLQGGDEVVVLVNNFGGLSQLEQGIVVKEVVSQLKNMEISPLRIYSGAVMTSLDAVGVHVSILRLSGSEKSLLLECLDEKTDAPAWPGRAYSLARTSINGHRATEASKNSEKEEVESDLIGPALNESQQKLLEKCLKRVCQDICENEKFINDLDSGCGDGDCGSTLKRLAEGIASSMGDLTWSHPASLLAKFANIAEDRMGGTSGAIYSLMFTTAANELTKHQKVDRWLGLWAKVWIASIDGIMKYSKARLGDRTMIDVLKPAACELEKHAFLPYEEAARKVVECAEACLENTKNMSPRAGRASYVKQVEYLKQVDAGAFGVTIWIKAIVDCL